LKFIISLFLVMVVGFFLFQFTAAADEIRYSPALQMDQTLVPVPMVQHPGYACRDVNVYPVFAIKYRIINRNGPVIYYTKNTVGWIRTHFRESRKIQEGVIIRKSKFPSVFNLHAI